MEEKSIIPVEALNSTEGYEESFTSSFILNPDNESVSGLEEAIKLGEGGFTVSLDNGRIFKFRGKVSKASSGGYIVKICGKITELEK